MDAITKSKKNINLLELASTRDDIASLDRNEYNIAQAPSSTISSHRARNDPRKSRAIFRQTKPLTSQLASELLNSYRDNRDLAVKVKGASGKVQMTLKDHRFTELF